MRFGSVTSGPEVKQRISVEGHGRSEPFIYFMAARMQRETGENTRSKILFGYLPLETNIFQPGRHSHSSTNLLPTVYSKSECISVFAPMQLETQNTTAPRGLRVPLSFRDLHSGEAHL